MALKPKPSADAKKLLTFKKLEFQMLLSFHVTPDGSFAHVRDVKLFLAVKASCSMFVRFVFLKPVLVSFIFEPIQIKKTFPRHFGVLKVLVRSRYRLIT